MNMLRTVVNIVCNSSIKIHIFLTLVLVVINIK